MPNDCTYMWNLKINKKSYISTFAGADLADSLTDLLLGIFFTAPLVKLTFLLGIVAAGRASAGTCRPWDSESLCEPGLFGSWPLLPLLFCVFLAYWICSLLSVTVRKISAVIASLTFFCSLSPFFFLSSIPIMCILHLSFYNENYPKVLGYCGRTKVVLWFFHPRVEFSNPNCYLLIITVNLECI